MQKLTKFSYSQHNFLSLSLSANKVDIQPQKINIQNNFLF